MIGFLPVPTSAAETVVLDLSGAPPGRLPPGFVSARTGKGAAAEWSVQDDASVPGGRVLAQTSADPTDHRFPLAIYEAVSAADVEVGVRFKAVAGRVDRAAGIALRLADADNYYVARANALEDNVNFYRVVRGARREIHGAPARSASGVWHMLGFRAEASRFTVSLNGQALFTATDRTFPGAGKIGLWTKADSVTRFDALTLRVLP
ncbi:MAG TPA: hypothetical protein VGC80_15415 [Acetobacteraceae bacterium]